MKRRNRVLVVATTFPRREGDDQPRFVLDLCKLVPDEYEQRVLVPSAPGCSGDDVIEAIEVRRFRYFLNRAETLAYRSGILSNLKEQRLRWFLVPFFVFGLTLSIRKELRRFKPDVVHVHWWLPSGFAAWLALATTNGDCRLLTTCHGGDYFVLGERFPRLRKWVFERSDAVTMVSAAMRDHAISQGLPSEKLIIASMGVDFSDRFKPDPYARRRGVLYVGRLVEKKGVDVLLAGWAAASDRVRAQGLTIIGSGAQQESLQALSDSLGVSDSVNFAGPVSHDDLPVHYQNAALLVFPSTISSDNDQEGLGLVAIEAMGCDCPVLTSSIGSLSDVVVEGETGFVFPMDDSVILAARLDELIPSPDLCNEVAIRGGEFVRSRFGWPAVGNTYGSLYAELLRPGEQAAGR